MIYKIHHLLAYNNQSSQNDQINEYVFSLLFYYFGNYTMTIYNSLFVKTYDRQLAHDFCHYKIVNTALIMCSTLEM